MLTRGQTYSDFPKRIASCKRFAYRLSIASTEAGGGFLAHWPDKLAQEGIPWLKN
jgi:hypothetical protein